MQHPFIERTEKGACTIVITSVANSQIKQICAYVQKAKERKKDQVFVVEGLKMFLEAPGEQIQKIYLTEQFWEKNNSPQLEEKLASNSIEFVSPEVYAKMSDTQTPQGILTLLKQPIYQLEALLEKPQSMFVVLEGLQDPGNVGTIIRTAEAAGASGVLLTKESVDIFNPKTIRSTMGSIYRVPFLYIEEIEDLIAQMKKASIQIYATHLQGETYFSNCDYTESIAFLIGNEGNGLKETTAQLADAYVKIPMAGEVESLNAAVASSLFMYEVYKQRTTK